MPKPNIIIPKTIGEERSGLDGGGTVVEKETGV